MALIQWLSVFLFAGYVYSEEVPCTTTREACTKANTTYSALYLANGAYECCLAGYSMAKDDGKCVCNKTSEVTDCLACAEAGKSNCCPAGFSALTFSGDNVTACACSKSLMSSYTMVNDGSGANYTYYVGQPGSLDIEGLKKEIEDNVNNVKEEMNEMTDFMHKEMEEMQNEMDKIPDFFK